MLLKVLTHEDEAFNEKLHKESDTVRGTKGQTLTEDKIRNINHCLTRQCSRHLSDAVDITVNFFLFSHYYGSLVYLDGVIPDDDELLQVIRQFGEFV